MRNVLKFKLFVMVNVLFPTQKVFRFCFFLVYSFLCISVCIYADVRVSVGMLVQFHVLKLPLTIYSN